LTAAYTLPVSESVGDITVAATFSHTDDYYLRQTRVEDYDLLNLNLNWGHVFGSPVDLALFGTNVTNAEYYTSNSDSLLGDIGFVNSVTGTPRMYGLRLRYNFGAAAN
jgi:iron complex outermembrane receptor protein